MATHIGNEGAVYVGANQILEVRSFSVEQSSATVEDTVMGDTWTSSKATLKSWSASIEAYWDETDTTGQGALDVGAEVTLNLYPEGNSSTDTYLSGSAIVESVSISASFDGMVEVSFSCKGNGALTESTVA